MVQHENPTQSKDCTTERSFDCSQPSLNETRLIPITPHCSYSHDLPHSHPHDLPLNIKEYLRSCTRIPVKEFAVIAILDDGQEVNYTSQNLTNFQPRIFSQHLKNDFHRSIQKATYHQDNESDIQRFSGIDSTTGKKTRTHQLQQNSDETNDDSMGSKKIKRYREYTPSPEDMPSPIVERRRQYDEFSEDLSSSIVEKKTIQLRIGDEDEVEKFYTCRFIDMQQFSCKIMGKAFVKLIEPKKQTHYPYTKGPEKSPPWWPSTFGKFSVPHKEPDHLRKPGLNIQMLEEFTMEALSNFFNNKENPGNLAKKPFIKEIFKVAKKEEEYKNGEITGDIYIQVMFGNKNGAEIDEPEEGKIVDEISNDDEDLQSQDMEASSLNNTTSLSVMQIQQIQQALPHSSQQREHNMYAPPRHVNSQPEDHIHDSSYMNTTAGSSYMNTTTGYVPQINFNKQNSPSQRSMSTSMTTTQFQNPQQSNVNWTPSFYNNASQSQSFISNPPQSFSSNLYQLPPPNSTSQSFISNPPQSFSSNLYPPNSHPVAQPLHNNFDRLPHRSQYDATPQIGSQLRTGSLEYLHQVPTHQHHGVFDFLDDNTYENHDADMKSD
ncbi:hypothetical protein SBOR_6653 [Sclerotinia borealis F-4128]|uniref:Subtelomeric hrmA-associated cluster protein AFUB-079030/YDR124W-like helical bundle domain-containing protein n=1 Tax=Sclerotinia borealis (strain F-4128) TaxID=1432307 RepID=W9C8B2_SCLBF|nr:hypothetical protein SBOR_6653 [Sclerotinia borealis F-4128]